MNFINRSIVYLSTNILNRSIPFFLLPILTRYLTPEEYGLVALFHVLINFFSPLVGLGMQVSISRNYLNMDRERFSDYLGNIVILLTASCTFFLIFVNLALIVSPGLFSISPRWAAAVPLIVTLNSVNLFNLILYQTRENPVSFAVLEILKTILNVAISLSLIVYFGFNWEGRFIGVSVSIVFTGLISLFILVKYNYVRFRFSRSLSGSILRNSLPSVPHYLSSFVISLSDRYFLDKMVGKDAVGIYSVGYNFGMIMSMVTDAFTRSWSPWFYKKIKTGSEADYSRIIRYTYLYFAGLIIAASMLIILSKIMILYLIDPRFAASFQFVGWVAFGYVIHGYYQMLFPYIVQAGKTKVLGIATGTAALSNLFLNYFLIKLNGPIGAAQATLISYFISCVILFIIVNRYFKMPWLNFGWGREK